MSEVSPRLSVPTRSVVICAFTEARWDRLSAAVTSAFDQLANGDELVVVIDFNPALFTRASTAFAAMAKVVENRHERGLSGARNTGVDEAAGSVVVFLDDDAEAAEAWLDNVTQPFSDASVVGVGGAADPVWDGGEAAWWMPEEFYWVVGCSYRGLPTSPAEIRNPIGCNMAFRTEAVREVGGFSAALGRIEQKPIGGEETDLAIRIRNSLGGRIVYQPSALVRHAVEKPRQRFGYFARRCFGEGRSKAVLARRVGATDATEAERAYLVTLAGGLGLRLVRVVRERSLRPAVQAVALVAGTAITSIGFGLGLVSMVRPRNP